MCAPSLAHIHGSPHTWRDRHKKMGTQKFVIEIFILNHKKILSQFYYYNKIIIVINFALVKDNDG